MPTMRVIFAGTPEFALPALAVCREQAELVAVYTQPDRPAGRGRKLTPSPVKQAALEAGIPVEQPESLRPAAARQRLAGYAPDLMVVVAYGLILPRKVLAIPGHGCWNLHASLLPRWRGAAPIQRAILAGDVETGVCLMQMEAGLDTGPVLLAERTPISDDDTAGSLHDRLARLAANVLADGLARLRDGSLPAAQAQPEVGVSYAAKLDKAEGMLDFAEPASALARKVRAFDPWPGTRAELAGETVRVHAAHHVTGNATASPGTVLGASGEGIDIACGEGLLRLTRLQRPGGRPLSAAEYLNGRPELRRG